MGSKNDDFFGGMFDFNGDGKTDLGEEFLAYQIFEEVMKEETNDTESDDDGFDSLNYSSVADSFVSDPPQQPHNPTRQAVIRAPSVAEPLPETLTFDQYKIRRSAFLRECFFSAFAALLLGALPGIVIYAAIATYDPKNSASGFLVTVFVIAGIAAIVMIMRGAFAGTSEKYQRLQQAKEIYLNHAPAEELSQQRKKKRRIAISICSLIGAGILILITVSAVRLSRTVTIYNEALDQITNGNYEQASAALRQIEGEGYKDTHALLLLCKAHKEYDAGRAIDAYYTMQEASFFHQTAEQGSEITSFRQLLKSEYDAYIHEQAERSQREYERVQSLPFPSVGQYVSKSQLDQMHWEGNDNKTCNVHTTKYLYTGGGEQYRLWISDYNSIKKVVKLSKSSSGTSAGKTGTSSLDTGPNVEGFSNPEDFYDWYWDDFFDYEDAEDYYYSHGGK